MNRNEVRFHLLKGANYQKWQVKVMQGSKKSEVLYYDPSAVQIEMRGCLLYNNLNKARKVFAEQQKDVSGHVRCEEVRLLDPESVPVEDLERLFYNPIRDIHWRRESDLGEFAWDESEYFTLITQGRQVYILEERS